MNTDFRERFSLYIQHFDKILKDYISSLQLYPEILQKSVTYSLEIGGKRVRPVLMYATAQMLGREIEFVDSFALSLELIHTYSLIHDDLPAMDNDDYRRGKLSNHKVFGEANAILAGDALLNEAYRICFSECGKGINYINAARLVCKNAGVMGMIAGQAADLLNEGNKNFKEAELLFIMENKTAKMIESAIVVPAVLLGVNKSVVDLLICFAKNLGILFQITDDILDVTGNFNEFGKTIGKDAYSGKMTCVTVYGLKNSVEKAKEYHDKCLYLLKKLPYESDFLANFVNYVFTRKN